ncbi:curli assembly protein CsgC [Cedecea davisae]|uniref:Curli assembly protein CsgC n=1 Tax=Cedecea davisae TaxID=158484 RepID=A0ABS6DLN6_9ENTR|nr:curli assembly chaperone CsgC [Cedecea davisae]MBU4684033.1 curli assembly protein CsgC [Cedecea davisae]MBU4688182.1 curli assembly protein CsgC [Cedecea davisae]
MHTLVLLAALSSQLTFNTRQQDNIYTITPIATLAADCQCTMTLAARRSGTSGQSESKQSSDLFIKAHEAVPLSQLSMNIDPGDSVVVTVTLSDGKSFHLEQHWAGAGKP